MLKLQLKKYNKWDRKPVWGYQDEAGPSVMEFQIEEAVKHGVNVFIYDYTHPNLKVPLITVNSWNEWTETSYLQPDNVYGYGYLEAIKRVFVEEE